MKNNNKTTVNSTPPPAGKAKSVPEAPAKSAASPRSSSRPAVQRLAALRQSEIQPRAEKTLTDEEVSTLAYMLYVRAGFPEGRELEHWLEAEAQLGRY